MVSNKPNPITLCLIKSLGSGQRPVVEKLCLATLVSVYGMKDLVTKKLAKPNT